MRISILAALAAATAIGATGPSMAQNKPVRDAGDAAAGPAGAASASTVGSYSTSGFVRSAARGDMFEIEASKLAQARASSPDIKSFAADMIKAHTQTTAGLKMAMRKGDVTTSLPSKLDARRQGLLDNLRASTDAEFDARYVKQQIAAHEEALQLMNGYAAHGDNAALKAAAAKTAPIVADHLRMAKALPGATA